MSRPNFERLRLAFSVIDGIPEEAFDLDRWTTDMGSSLSCGTIACAGGWLARHPSFMELGLGLSAGGDPKISGAKFGMSSLAKFFGLDLSKNEERLFYASYFKDTPYYTLPDGVYVSHKILWQRRLIGLLDHYGQHVDKGVRARVFAGEVSA